VGEGGEGEEGGLHVGWSVELLNVPRSRAPDDGSQVPSGEGLLWRGRGRGEREPRAVQGGKGGEGGLFHDALCVWPRLESEALPHCVFLPNPPFLPDEPPLWVPPVLATLRRHLIAARESTCDGEGDSCNSHAGARRA